MRKKSTPKKTSPIKEIRNKISVQFPQCAVIIETDETLKEAYSAAMSVLKYLEERGK